MIVSRFLVSEPVKTSSPRGLAFPTGSETLCEHGESEPHMTKRPCPEDLGPNVSCTVLHFTLCAGPNPQPVQVFYVDSPRRFFYRGKHRR